jgi:hypothetical protein
MGGLLAFSLFVSTALSTVHHDQDIYIAMDGRHEMRLAPTVDTMKNKEEYIYKMTLDPAYNFSQLSCEGGLVYKQDNFLHITPHSNKTTGVDTVKVRFVLFAENKRLLLYKNFYVKLDNQVYPNANQNPKDFVAMDNTILERNMAYPKINFQEQSLFHCITPNHKKDTTERILSVNISLVNSAYNRSFNIKGNLLTKDIIAEIRKQKLPTQAYVKLQIQVGNHQKTVWSRFMIPS